MNTVLTVICSWCKRVMVQGNSLQISHGLCALCALAMKESA